MKKILVTLLLASALFGAATEKLAISQPIPELKLTNGVVFRNVTVVRYDSTTVVLKSSAGTGPLSYTMIPEPLRAEMLRQRDAARTAVAVNAAKPRMVSGQVFITTRAAGAYKFSGATVLVYSLSDYKRAADAQRVELAASREGKAMAPLVAWQKAFEGCTPITSAQTDAEGRYTLALASDPVVLVCCTFRQWARSNEYHLWIEQVDGTTTTCDLNSSNKCVTASDAPEFPQGGFFGR